MTPLALSLLVAYVVCCAGTPGTSGLPSPPRKLLTIAEVCARVPGARGARRLHPATVSRWILRGCRSRAGGVVKLAAVRVGCRWMVEETQLEIFYAALAESGPAAATTTSAACTDGQRSRASRRAADELARRGA